MSVDCIEKFDNAKTESVSSNPLIDELYESRRATNSYDTRQGPSSTAVNELFGTLEIVQPTSEQKPAEKIQNVSAEAGDGKVESKPESNAANAATASSFEDILFLLLMKYAEKKEKEQKKA